MCFCWPIFWWVNVRLAAGKRNKEMGITGEDWKEDASDLQHALNEK